MQILGSSVIISTPPGPGKVVIGSAVCKYIVVIDLTDGAVTIAEGYCPDTAAKAFWDAVEKEFGNRPSFRME